jgi:hypothetical protein
MGPAELLFGVRVGHCQTCLDFSWRVCGTHRDLSGVSVHDESDLACFSPCCAHTSQPGDVAFLQSPRVTLFPLLPTKGVELTWPFHYTAWAFSRGKALIVPR